MSQNITIKEGDISQGFGHINKLRTSNGSDYDRWVPEDEVDTDSLHADKNGLYYTRAYTPTKKEKKKGKKGDCYGYDSVTVSIINQTYGKDPSGNPIGVGVDEEGNLIETELPVRIEIVKDPDTLTYVDGQDISIDGIQVKAYMADGSEYETGTEGNYIPVEQLSAEPPKADISKAKEGSATSDIQSIQQYVPFAIGKVITYQNYDGSWTDSHSVNEVGAKVLFSHQQQDDTYLRIVMASDEPISGSTDSYTYNGKKVYYYTWSILNRVHVLSPETIEGISYDNGAYDRELAWTMVYGTITQAGQEITVNWIPPEGVEELTDTFKITVGQGPIPPNN